MMKRISNFGFLACAIMMTSFSNVESEKAEFKTGTYGVCGCEGKSASANTIKLTINEDHSFSYYNVSNPNEEIELTGDWTAKGNSIVLEKYESGKGIHNKWRMDKNGVCVKSRNGLNFMRLCLMKDCE